MPSKYRNKRKRCEFCGKAFTQITTHLRKCSHSAQAIKAILKAAVNPLRPERKRTHYPDRKSPRPKYCPQCGKEFFTVTEHIRVCPGGVKAAAAAATALDAARKIRYPLWRAQD